MFKFHFTLCVLLVFLYGCQAKKHESFFVKPQAASVVTLDPYAWDFGQVKQGQIIKHDFIFKNNFQKVLKIKNIDTSCGCTVSEVQKKVLLPQESTLVEVKFNAKGYSGDIKQFVYVNTDNVDNPVTRFIIKANVTK